MLCAKFGWKWHSGSREKDENVKSLETDRWTDGRRMSDDQKSSRVFSSNELKSIQAKGEYFEGQRQIFKQSKIK